MDLLSIFAIFFVRLLISCVGAQNAESDNKTDAKSIVNITTTTTAEPYFSDMPENIEINTIDAETLLQFDNKGERMMGVSDDKCDNAKVNLPTDFDPDNQTEIESLTKCHSKHTWKPDNLTDPVLTIMNVPRRYIPIHKCMHVKINYVEKIPSIAPHRPLWARYGEYVYCPLQRWLHNVEHGGIVGLYHPCAEPEQVALLKSTIKKCLFRHVITPYPKLTEDRPIAIVGWSASLEMSSFDFDLVKNFIKFYAKTGPERVFRDGQYGHLLIEKAQYVTNVIDSELCPHM